MFNLQHKQGLIAPLILPQLISIPFPICRGNGAVQRVAGTAGDGAENEDFHLQMLQADNDEEYDSHDVDEDVGFGNDDMYDITDFLECGDEDTGVKEEEGLETTEEVINKLKHGCVAKKLLHSYTTALNTFFIYIYKFDRYLMHKSWK